MGAGNNGGQPKINVNQGAFARGRMGAGATPTHNKFGINKNRWAGMDQAQRQQIRQRYAPVTARGDAVTQGAFASYRGPPASSADYRDWQFADSTGGPADGGTYERITNRGVSYPGLDKVRDPNQVVTSEDMGYPDLRQLSIGGGGGNGGIADSALSAIGGLLTGGASGPMSQPAADPNRIPNQPLSQPAADPVATSTTDPATPARQPGAFGQWIAQQAQARGNPNFGPNDGVSRQAWLAAHPNLANQFRDYRREQRGLPPIGQGSEFTNQFISQLPDLMMRNNDGNYYGMDPGEVDWKDPASITKAARQLRLAMPLSNYMRPNGRRGAYTPPSMELGRYSGQLPMPELPRINWIDGSG